MKESNANLEKEGEKENNIFGNYKILKQFEEKDLFLASRKEKKISSQNNYLLKRIEVKSETEKLKIYKNINKYNLVHLEERVDDKIILFILMKVTKSINFQRINEFVVKKEEDAWSFL